jgi:hypothetical protein
VHHLWLPQDVLHQFSAIAAKDFVTCRRIALANMHKLLQKMEAESSMFGVGN